MPLLGRGGGVHLPGCPSRITCLIYVRQSEEWQPQYAYWLTVWVISLTISAR